MDIQAAILWEQGKPLSVEAATLDAPGPGEVLVEMQAAGVCHSDLHPSRGDWPMKVPVILGHEGAGVVRDVGAGVSRVKKGDHVVLCWAPSCGECPSCLEGRAVMCDRVEKVTFRNKLPSGTTRLHARGADVAPFLGTACFADAVVVPEAGAIPVARDIPFEALATLGCAVITGVGAVVACARVPAGATVAVIGAGGVGLNVVLTGLSRADAQAAFPMFPFVMQEKYLLGSVYGSGRPAEDIPRLAQWFQEGKLKLRELVARTYALDGINDALNALASSDGARGVITW